MLVGLLFADTHIAQIGLETQATVAGHRPEALDLQHAVGFTQLEGSEHPC